MVAVGVTACLGGSGRATGYGARATTTIPVSTSSGVPSTTATAPPAPTTAKEPSTTTTSTAPPGSPSLNTSPASGSGGGDYAAQLKWAHCMQAHGEDVPDPHPPGSGPSTQSKGTSSGPYVLDSSGSNTQSNGNVDPNSPQYLAASKACQDLLPAGSGPSLSGPGAP